MARQYFIPGQGQVNETGTRQYFIPGWGYVNATVVNASAGEADGSSAVTGIGDAVFQGVGSAAGSSTVTAASAGTVQAVGEADGSSNVTGIAPGLGTAATGTISGTGGIIGAAPREYFIPGWGNYKQTGKISFFIPGWGYLNESSPQGNVGYIEGTSTVSGASYAGTFSAGSSAGTSLVSGAGASTAAASGEADGTSTVAGAGQATTLQSAAGSSSGMASATGAGSSVFSRFFSYYNPTDLFNYFDISTARNTPTLAAGEADGSSTVAGSSGISSPAEGFISGTSIAQGVGAANAAATGTTAGTSTATGSGNAITLTPLSLPSGALAVYSVAQLQGWGGNCLQVQRVSDNAQMDIGFVNGRLDTATAFAFGTGTTLMVTKWYDQTGNAYDATLPASLIASPLLRPANAVNGLQGITGFDYTNNLGIAKLILPTALTVSRQSYSVITCQSLGMNSGGAILTLGTDPTSSNNLSIYINAVWGSSQTGIYPFGWFSAGQFGRTSVGIQRHSVTQNVVRYNGYQQSKSTLQTPSIMSGGMLDGTYEGGETFCVAIYGTMISDAACSQIETAFGTAFNVVLGPNLTQQVIFDGDSITAAFTSGNYGLGYVNQTAQLLIPNTSAINTGVDGVGMGSRYTNVANIIKYKNPNGPNVSSIFAGTNDLQNIGSGGIVGYGTYIFNNYLLPYIQAMQAGGFVGVATGTMLPRAWTGGTTYFNQCETERAAYNSLILSNASTYNYSVADFASLFGTSGNPTNTQYCNGPPYSVDGIHPNPATAARMAAMYAPVINSLL